ncbi:MAG: cobalamin biosynthesis protein CobW [Lachnospiraceae bacterium]|nr:cobalamin biosynthesis protein CobW [Lachnospiraceae bacterium]
MAKIDIISGFLGAGKTTLIKKLVGEAFKGEKLVLIENEFGEIGIDGGFLKDSGVEVTEMNSGCICCSLVGDFGTALQEVVEKFSPDRIIIEPSGVGKLSDVIKAVIDVKDKADIELNSTTAVVDGMKTKMYMKNFGEFFNNQVESAGTIVISRTQKLPEAKLNETVELLREHNEKAAIITTPWDELTGEQLLSAIEKKGSMVDELFTEEELKVHGHEHHHHEEGEECCHGHEHHHHEEGEECCHGHEHHHHEEGEECCHGHEHHHHEEGEECCHGHEHHHHEEGEECCHGHHHEHGHHHADDVFTSWGVETPHKFTEDMIKEALGKLSDSEEFGIILRAKGIVQGADGQWIHFDLVPGEYEVRNGAADYTGRICVIGTDLKEDKLKELFNL